MEHANIQKDLQQLADPIRATLLQRYFKTGKDQYAEGDKFIGITCPEQRGVAKKYRDIELVEVEKLLHSDIHEHRFTALEILVFKFESALKEKNEKVMKSIITLYLRNTKYINNWDLVDTSASYLLGNWLLYSSEKSGSKDSRVILYKLAKSKLLWERRIAIISTAAFIRADDYSDTLKLAKILLDDRHDLIHKAVGWMLREVGKRNEKVLCKFLDKYYKVMPRTMLRYAIERLVERKRRGYLL